MRRDMTLETVAVPKKVLIAGKWWKLRPFTAQERKNASKKGVGACWYGPKLITYHPRQHREEMLDTFLHEGLHAIFAERSYVPPLAALISDEKTIPMLVSDIMGYLKQIADVNLKKGKA